MAPYLLRLNPGLAGSAADFFDSEILLVNLPPRNKNGIQDFHKNQLTAIRHEAIGRVSNIIFISSTAVYPAQNKEVVESEASQDCLSRGGIPLLEMENLFAMHEQLATTVIRFGGLYGPDRHPGRFLAGKGNLAGADNPINMIHLEDCIGVIQAIIEQEVWNEVFNACSPSQETRKSFYQKAALDLGIEPPSFSNETAPFKRVNASRLISKTGYRFKH